MKRKSAFKNRNKKTVKNKKISVYLTKTNWMINPCRQNKLSVRNMEKSKKTTKQ